MWTHALLILMAVAAACRAQNCLPNTTHVCQCDSQCDFFNDCCAEAMKERTRPPGPTYYSCLRSDRLRIQFESYFSPRCANGFITVINKCPPTFEDAGVITDCEQTTIDSGFVYDVPVVDSNLRLFRNRFCAQCHDVGSVEKANVTVFKCQTPPTRENLAAQLKMGSCTVALSVPKPSLRFCPPLEVTSCPAKHPASRACSSGAAQRVFCGKRNFRNVACARCAGFAETDCRQSSRPCLLEGIQTRIYPDYRFLFDFLSEPKNNTNSSQGQEGPKEIVITICSALSIAALLILLILYAALKPFHNFAGLMTATLAACMVAAYCLLLVSGSLRKGTTACAVVGRFLHLAFLASFAWMALMGFDLLRNFRHKTGSRDSSFWRRYLKYGSFGWGAPLLVMGLGLLLDFADPDSSVSPNFGAPNCYMNRPHALLLWMFVPVALIIVFNCIILAFLFHFFYTSSQDTRRVRENVRRSMILLCVKVTLVLGVVWLAQLIDVFNRQSAEASFIVSIFSSLQGLGIAFVFLLTKQTKANVKSSISRTKTTSSTISTAKHRVVNTGGQRSATSSQEKL